VKPDLRIMFGIASPQTSLLQNERVKFFGPACICGSRETSHIGPGRRHCKKCGLVEFRITSDGYRGVRVVTPSSAAVGASRKSAPASPTPLRPVR